MLFCKIIGIKITRELTVYQYSMFLFGKVIIRKLCKGKVHNG